MNQALWIVGSPDADGLVWLFVCRVSAYRHACGWIDGLQELFLTGILLQCLLARVGLVG